MTSHLLGRRARPFIPGDFDAEVIHGGDLKVPAPRLIRGHRRPVQATLRTSGLPLAT